MNIDFSVALAQLQEIFTNSLKAIPNILVGLIIIGLTMIIARKLRDMVRRLLERSNKPESLAVALGRVTRWSAITLGILLGLLVMFPGFSAGQLIQLLGVGGLAAGIAFRNIFEDFLAGLLLLLNEPFTIGDQIVVADVEGTIEEIQARITTIRTYDGRKVVVPNSELFTDIVTVNTAYAFRRVEYDIGIGYSDDIELAQRVILDVLRATSNVEAHPEPEAIVVELAPYSVTLRARWWIKPPRRSDLVSTRNRILAQIKHALREQGIDLPFPTQQVLFHDQTEASDGDRMLQREGWPSKAEGNPEPNRIVDAVRSLKPSAPDDERQANKNSTTER